MFPRAFCQNLFLVPASDCCGLYKLLPGGGPWPVAGIILVCLGPAAPIFSGGPVTEGGGEIFLFQ